MPTTKQRIILNSRKLFSEHGIANTRLQQIADETGISVGNLAYHFKSKEEIVQALYHNTLDELSNILIMSKIYPSLESFDAKFSNLYQFMENNIFYFTNRWEIKRNYPIVNGKIKDINKKILSKLKKRINDNVGRGVMNPEKNRGFYDSLSATLLNSINTWLPQQLLNEKTISEKKFKIYLWTLLHPHLTSKGKTEFKSLDIF
ncbi:MAG: TetR/AcrR family transcriptional regulator [Ginsengibacter sp.]